MNAVYISPNHLISLPCYKPRQFFSSARESTLSGRTPLIQIRGRSIVSACLNVDVAAHNTSKSKLEKTKDVIEMEGKFWWGHMLEHQWCLRGGRLVKAVVEQAATLTHTSNIFYTIPQRHTTTNGKEPATEFIAFSNGFHGRTLGALALTSSMWLGRTGLLWAHEAYGVFPDMMTLQSLLLGGLPIGLVLVTESVASSINYGDHGSTFAGNPLVCSAAIAVFDKISKPEFLSSVSKKGLYFKELLRQKLGGNRHVREIRGVGLIIGVDLDVPASPFVEACQNSGLLVLTAGKGNVVRIVPPLIITEKEIEQAVHILFQNLKVLDK
ncbi:hypothetical protein ACSQ67_011345 [Phaseolus vulgaris]